MKDKREIYLVFVRHAHRDKPIPDEDNGLSEKGRGQVEDLVKAYKKSELAEAAKFYSSPKKRCVETLKPIALAAGASLVIDKLLDERGEGESGGFFKNRMEELADKLTEIQETTYVCSHGDVIPAALDFILGDPMDIGKGKTIVLRKTSKEKWTLA